MQTWFILVRPLPVPTSSPQATHLRFSTLFVKSFYKVWITQGQPFPCVQESSTTRDPRSLNPFSEIRREEEISLKRERLYNEDQSKFLIEYASGWPRNLFERIRQFSSEKLLIFWEDKTFWAMKNLFKFVFPSHLWRPFINHLNRCDSWKLFSENLLR